MQRQLEHLDRGVDNQPDFSLTLFRVKKYSAVIFVDCLLDTMDITIIFSVLASRIMTSLTQPLQNVGTPLHGARASGKALGRPAAGHS